MKKRGITSLFERECSLCHFPMIFKRVTNETDVLVMNTGCDCVDYDKYVTYTFDQLQAFFDAQPDEAKKGIVKKWGFE